MKKAISFILQFLLFFAAFGAGIVNGAIHLLNLRWFVTHPTPRSTSYFDPTGLFLMLSLYLLILLIEAARKTIRTSGAWTTGAFALAAIAGFALKFGFVGPILW